MAEVSKADLEKEIESWRIPKLFMMNWNERNTLTLIQLIRERPVLWNAMLEDYKNELKKLNAVIEVAKMLEITKEEVMLKWISLMEQYYKVRKKEQKCPEKWFEEMSSILSRPHQPTSGLLSSNKPHLSKSGQLSSNRPHQPTSGLLSSNKPHQPTSDTNTSDNNAISSSQIVFYPVLPLPAMHTQELSLPIFSGYNIPIAAMPEPRSLLTVPPPVLPQQASSPISSTNTLAKMLAQQNNPAVIATDTLANMLAQQNNPAVRATDTLAPLTTIQQTMPTPLPTVTPSVPLQQASTAISSTNMLAQQSIPAVTATDTLAPLTTISQTMPSIPAPLTTIQQTMPTPLPNMPRQETRRPLIPRSQQLNQRKRKQHFDVDKEDRKKTASEDKIATYARYISDEINQLSPFSQTNVKLGIQKLIFKYALKDLKDIEDRRD